MNDLKDLNYYGLKVEGLSAGKYALSIDGKPVATFTDKQLAEGVNLGNLQQGPVYDQALKVAGLINAKNQLVHQRFRGVVMYAPPAFPTWAGDLGKQLLTRKAEEQTKRLEAIDARQAEVYAAAKPAKRSFKLEPAKGE
jgi:hypothetical protein